MIEWSEYKRGPVEHLREETKLKEGDEIMRHTKINYRPISLLCLISKPLEIHSILEGGDNLGMGTVEEDFQSRGTGCPTLLHQKLPQKARPESSARGTCIPQTSYTVLIFSCISLSA